MLNGRVAYSAVVLDKKSRIKLIQAFRHLIPEDWEVIAHHLTINLGEIDPEYEKYLGLNIRLTVNEFAIDDKVAAVGVDGFSIKVRKPHITLGVNRKNGGKPVMSNHLTNWETIKRPLTVTGKVEEVQFKI